MYRYTVFTLLAALLLGGTFFADAAERPLPKQLQKIEMLQRRADILAHGELGTDNYHLAKARTWLDMALSEYYEGDNNVIVPAVIEQAIGLLDALEKKQANISMDTPVQLPGSEAVRPDLWEIISSLKSNEKFSCGQRAIAEAEVHLVWTGHEKFKSSWEYAQSYALSAEELIREAQAAIVACTGSPLVQATPMPEKFTLSSEALFSFGSARFDASSLWRLNRLADSIKKEAKLEEVTLVGHTDHLRGDGRHELNQILSEQRAESIRQYLIGKGIPPEKIHASGAGSSQPLVQCSKALSQQKQIACLKPNRRVEVVLRGSR